LMMGGKTRETCSAVNKRQDNKLKNWCIRLVIYLNCTMMHGLKYLFSSLSLCIKLTYVLIINYDIIIKINNTLTYTVWHVDKYKITFKLVISHWTNKMSFSTHSRILSSSEY
jgi:hypothetical protein